MELINAGPNARVIAFNDGARVLFSYGEPVALYDPAAGYRRSDKWRSRATDEHIAQFARGNVARVMPDADLLRTVREWR